MSPEDSIGGFEAKQHQPENAPLRRALARLATRRCQENRARVYEHLLNGPVLVAIAELPRNGAGRGLGHPLPVLFATAEGPAGEPALAAFSDPAAVAVQSPSNVWLAIEPRALLLWIAAESLGGMVLNPRGLSAFVSREDILELAGLRAQNESGTGAPKLAETAETAIHTAIGRLYEEPNPHAFLVLAEKKTKKAVQFARALDGTLTLDVFASTLTGEETRRARQVFDGIAGYVDELPRAADDLDLIGGAAPRANETSFKAIFSGDVANATQSAMKIFTWVFGLPPGFDLSIEMR